MGAVGGLLGGCDTPEVKRLNDPALYVERANASYADSDVESALLRILEERHGDVNAPLRAAIRANRRVTRAKLIAPTPDAFPPAEPHGKVVHVAAVVHADGRLTDVVTETAESARLTADQLVYVERIVRSWRLAPATIDGQQVPCLDSFRVETDGATYVRRMPQGH